MTLKSTLNIIPLNSSELGQGSWRKYRYEPEN